MIHHIDYMLAVLPMVAVSSNAHGKWPENATPARTNIGAPTVSSDNNVFGVFPQRKVYHIEPATFWSGIHGSHEFLWFQCFELKMCIVVDGTFDCLMDLFFGIYFWESKFNGGGWMLAHGNENGAINVGAIPWRVSSEVKLERRGMKLDTVSCRRQVDQDRRSLPQSIKSTTLPPDDEFMYFAKKDFLWQCQFTLREEIFQSLLEQFVHGVHLRWRRLANVFGNVWECGFLLVLWCIRNSCGWRNRCGVNNGGNVQRVNPHFFCSSQECRFGLKVVQNHLVSAAMRHRLLNGASLALLFRN
mmetsp:Transcript_10537/g.39176  ORF Transcript_10537/g.39176 Transcript_10537/m.39176 type:complete len:301 (+) Transcript_10537:2176-3078(+)